LQFALRMARARPSVEPGSACCAMAETASTVRTTESATGRDTVPLYSSFSLTFS
jgi:hypothetical protein